MKREAEAKGAEVLFIRTDLTRRHAIDFYMKHGAEIAGRVEGYFREGGKRTPAIWLKTDL
jgi:ribosomal protein S18 acetylase RimI-like enzyme